MEDSSYIKLYKRDWEHIWYFLIWYDEHFNKKAETILFKDFYEAAKFAEEHDAAGYDIYTVKTEDRHD